jgi:hypothetical protein
MIVLHDRSIPDAWVRADMTVSGTVLLYYEIRGNPSWLLLEQALRHRKCEDRRYKASLVITAVIFAMEDHATT